MIGRIPITQVAHALGTFETPFALLNAALITRIIVCFVLSCNRYIGIRYWFQHPVADIITLVTVIAFNCGIIMKKNV